ncbi:MAG: acyl carrier protein [Clostridia bacterium]|nr:acyl carrier protein [Clostridia bacterium]
MTREEILNELKEIFKEVFGEEIPLTELTSAKDVKGWDSLTHIAIISSVEERFNMKFKMKQVLSMQNIGDMITIIEGN